MRSRRAIHLPYIFICAGATLWVLLVGIATAGEYEIVHGKGQELCEVCQQNLLRMTEHPACERTYDTEIGLAGPEWKPFDVAHHLDTMKQVMKFLRTGNEFAQDNYVMGEEQYEYHIRASSARKEQWAYLAQADINNNGKPDHVLRMPGGPCRRSGEGRSGAYSAPIVVLRDDLRGIDRNLTDLVVQNPEREFRFPGDTTYQLYSVFTYRGKTYFDRWNDAGVHGESQRSTLTIYESRDGKTKKRCQLKEA